MVQVQQEEPSEDGAASSIPSQQPHRYPRVVAESEVRRCHTTMRELRRAFGSVAAPPPPPPPAA